MMTKNTFSVSAIFSMMLFALAANRVVAQDQVPLEWIAQGSVAPYAGGSNSGVGFAGEPVPAGQVSRSIDRPLETQRAAVADSDAGQFPLLQVPGLSEDGGAEGADTGLAGPVITTVSSLLVVLAVFGGMVWVSRRFGSSRQPAGVLPEDVLKNLGSAAIDARTRVTFLKLGTRILVIGQTQNGEPQRLSEITDPDEVERLTNRCLGRPEIVGRRGSYSPGRDSSRRDLAAG
ncbi:MAG: flagellar biosynthetic protein FliO [Planctomycetales bacterium]|nr:flagellar biosynthetic protein FliO [Planctomycetales bacterium]